LKNVVFEEDATLIARCLDVEVTSEGSTMKEAIANLQVAPLAFNKTSPY